MVKSFYSILLFICCCNAVIAQLEFKQMDNGRTMEFRDLNGNSLMNDKYAADIEGFPFLNQHWVTADLQLKSKHQVNGVKVKLNMESNELYYLDSMGRTMVAMAGSVTRIAFTSFVGNEKTLYVFKNGFPSVYRQPVTYYYQLLSEGKIQLLKRSYKTIETFKNEMTSEKRREFVEREQYYIFASGEMKECRNEKQFILALMKDKSKAIDNFLLDNKISFKKIQDIQKLVDYYNGLK